MNACNNTIPQNRAVLNIIIIKESVWSRLNDPLYNQHNKNISIFAFSNITDRGNYQSLSLYSKS